MAEVSLPSVFPLKSSASLTPWLRCWTARELGGQLRHRQHLDVQAWQIAQIRHGIEEADRGDLIPHEEVSTEARAKIRQARDGQ